MPVDVDGSTAVKVAEIVALRERVAELYADRLAECAEAMAGAFAAGGRLCDVRQRRQQHRRPARSPPRS